MTVKIKSVWGWMCLENGTELDCNEEINVYSHDEPPRVQPANDLQSLIRAGKRVVSIGPISEETECVLELENGERVRLNSVDLVNEFFQPVFRMKVIADDQCWMDVGQAWKTLEEARAFIKSEDGAWAWVIVDEDGKPVAFGDQSGEFTDPELTCLSCNSTLPKDATDSVCAACTKKRQELDPYHGVPERIREWVSSQFPSHYVDQVTQDLIDVAAGNRDGNKFEKDALTKIMPEWNTQNSL